METRFVRRLNDVDHEIVVQFDPIFDKVTIEVDGLPAPTELKRRPFSNLWRYRFSVGATPLELGSRTDWRSQ